MNHTKKVPILRFPEFSGEWKERIIKEILKPVSDSVKVETNTLYQQIGIRSHGKGIFHKEFVTGESLGNKRVFWVKEKKFIVNIVFAWELAVAKTTKNELGMIASHRFPMYEPLNNLCSVDYIVYKFLTKKGKNLLELASPGGAGRNKTLGQGEFKKLKIIIPTLQEQQKIATFLSLVDSKIEQLTQKKQLLERYKKAMMQQLFSQQLRFKDHQGNDYPDWEVKALGDICEVNPKISKLPTNFIYIDLESVEKGVFKSKEVINIANAPSRAQRLLETNDILYQTVRPYQKNNLFFNINSGNYVASTGYAQLRTNNIPKFLYHLIHTESFVKRVMLRCTGTSYPAINSTDLSKIKVTIPLIPEQTKIANHLSQIDQKINQVDTQLKQAQQFKQGLLQKMFV